MTPPREQLALMAERIGLSPADVLELMQQFVELAAPQLTAMAGDDIDVVRRQAHSMKGSAATLGFEEIALAARDIEQAARTNRIAEVAPALAQLREHVAAATQLVRELEAEATHG